MQNEICDETDKEKFGVTVLFCNASAKCCAPCESMLLLSSLRVEIVYIRSEIIDKKNIESIRALPCCVVIRSPDVLPLSLRFHLNQARVLRRSVYKMKNKVKEMLR